MYDQEQILKELEQLRERERLCESVDKAEKLALIRALQEIRDEIGLIGDGVSPAQIVAAVRAYKDSAGVLREACVSASKDLRTIRVRTFSIVKAQKTLDGAITSEST